MVILTARRGDKLPACLKSLEGQSFKDFEVVVVDNDPCEETEGIVKECDLFVRLIRNPGAFSYADSRNRGIREADGSHIAFLDDDCVADAAWLQHLLEGMENADAVGGIVLPLRHLSFPPWWDSSLNWLIGLSEPGLIGPAGGSFHYPQTANMMIARQVLLEESFQEIGGGFKQGKTHRYAGREDVELWRRLRLGGKRCRIVPRAVVYHDISSDRLCFRYLLRRAFNDGLVYFRRERKLAYLSWAITDILRHPSAIGGSRKGKIAAGKSVATRILWKARQVGFVYGYLRGGNVLSRMAGTAWEFSRCLAGLFTARIKRRSRNMILRVYGRHRPSKFPVEPERILVAACGFLGDMVLLAPVIESLSRSLPKAKITLLSFETGRILFEYTGLFHDFIVCPSALKSRSLQVKKIRESLTGRQFDAIIIPYFHNAPPLPLYQNTSAPVATFDRDVGFGRRLFYDLASRRVKKDFSVHEVVNLLHLAGIAGARIPPRPYTFQIPGSAAKSAERCLAEHGVENGPFILFHPGAGYQAKKWPLENWAKLAVSLSRKRNIPVIFVGDKKDREKIDKQVGENDGSIINLCGQTGLWRLAALIKNSALLVTTDSGPKHLAMALDSPTLTLYGPTDERRWGAFGNKKKHHVIRAVSRDLSPEELLGLPPDYAMRLIYPEMVLDAIKEYAGEL